jgi:hypothetical protein
MSDIEFGYWMLMEMMLRAVSIICTGRQFKWYTLRFYQ